MNRRPPQVVHIHGHWPNKGVPFMSHLRKLGFVLLTVTTLSGCIPNQGQSLKNENEQLKQQVAQLQNQIQILYKVM